MPYIASERRRAQVRENTRRYRERQAAIKQTVSRDDLAELVAKCDRLSDALHYVQMFEEDYSDVEPLDRALRLLDALIEQYEKRVDNLNEVLEAEFG